MNFEIPDGLGDMLRDFTVSVLREHPNDLFDFAVDYFTKARENRKPKTVPMYIIVDDEEAGEPDPSYFKPKTNSKSRYARRHSVSAERYDPEEDDDEGDTRVIHPKTDDQRERLTSAVSGILLFRSLEQEQIREVIDAMFEKRVSPGDHVIDQGADGDNFYIVDEGTFDVLVQTDVGEKKVHEFKEKGSFGELALMYNMPRSATVVSATPGSLWAMDRHSFRRIVLKSAFKKRKMYESLIENVPMLKSLDAYERMSLADALTPQTYNEGACVIKEGEEADGMYFLEQGEICITITEKGHEQDVQHAAQDRYFGEMALVENKARSASVYAAGNIKVAFLERSSFERLLGPCLDIMKRNIKSYKKSS